MSDKSSTSTLKENLVRFRITIKKNTNDIKKIKENIISKWAAPFLLNIELEQIRDLYNLS